MAKNPKFWPKVFPDFWKKEQIGKYGPVEREIFLNYDFFLRSNFEFLKFDLIFYKIMKVEL